MSRKHNHYFKDVSNLQGIDVYRVLSLYNVTDPCIQHALKKLLVAGGRGAGKDVSKDIQEAIDSLVRWQEMRTEDSFYSPILSIKTVPIPVFCQAEKAECTVPSVCNQNGFCAKPVKQNG